MKFYINKAFLCFIYLFLTTLTAIVAITLPNNLLFLKIVIAILDIGLYAFWIGSFGYHTGYESVKTLYANDAIRRQMVETGNYMPIKKAEEYKWWKGFFIGFLTSVPLIILWIIHLTTIAVTGESTSIVGGLTIILYLVVVLFFNLDVNSLTGATGFFYTGLYFPFVILTFGVLYIIGAKKSKALFLTIEKKDKEIHGEK